MAKRSERLNLVAADNHSYNKEDPLPFTAKGGGGCEVMDPGLQLMKDQGSGDIFATWLHGGSGTHIRITYQKFVDGDYDNTHEEMPEGQDPETWERPPTELELERAKWEEYYGMSLEGRWEFAINVNIEQTGLAYKNNDEVYTSNQSYGKSGREIRVKIKTRNNGWQLASVSGATKSYWENNYINPKGAPYVVRELMGTRQQILDISGHKWGGVHGWQYTFSNNSQVPGYRKYGLNATDTSGLQIMTDNCIGASQGLVLGNILAHQTSEKQRWVIPKGISYCWDNRHSANNAHGLNLQAIKLLFKLGNEKITRYVSLVESSQFTGRGETFYSNTLVNNGSNNKVGVLRCFMTDDEFKYLHEYNARCIGTYMRYGNHSQGSFFDNVINFFNYRFLYSEESYSKSKMILPSPVEMQISQTKGIKL